MGNWLTSMSGVQANMNIESFKVQVAQTVNIPYEHVLGIIKEDQYRNVNFNKITSIQEVRRRWNIGLREAKTMVETVAYREGIINTPRLGDKDLSILMYGDYPDNA